MVRPCPYGGKPEGLPPSAADADGAADADDAADPTPPASPDLVDAPAALAPQEATAEWRQARARTICIPPSAAVVRRCPGGPAEEGGRPSVADAHDAVDPTPPASPDPVDPSAALSAIRTKRSTLQVLLATVSIWSIWSKHIL